MIVQRCIRRRACSILGQRWNSDHSLLKQLIPDLANETDVDVVKKQASNKTNTANTATTAADTNTLSAPPHEQMPPKKPQSKRVILSRSELRGYKKNRHHSSNQTASRRGPNSSASEFKKEMPRVDPYSLARLFSSFEQSNSKTSRDSSAEGDTETVSEIAGKSNTTTDSNANPNTSAASASSSSSSSSSLNDAESLMSYIDSFKPFETKISQTRYDSIAKELNSALTKSQLQEYVTHIRAKSHGAIRINRSATKGIIIKNIMSQVWKIEVSKTAGSVDFLLSTKSFDLSPTLEYFLRKPKSSFMKHLAASKIHAKIVHHRLIISGMTTKLGLVEGEFAQYSANLKSEKVQLSENVDNLVLDKVFTQYAKQIMEVASVHLSKNCAKEFTISAESDEGIVLAKRLIAWCIGDSNPHIKNEVFDNKGSGNDNNNNNNSNSNSNSNIHDKQGSLSNASYVPFINKESWPWHSKNNQYFKISKEDIRPGRYNDLLFEKFDMMNDLFIKDEDIGELENYSLALNINGDTSINEDPFLNNDTSDQLLKSLDGQNDTIESKNKSNDDESKSKISYWDGIIKNHSTSPSLKEEKDKHTNLEDLRHQLGKFADNEFDENEFPDVSKLIEDVEGKSNDDVLENLRKELGAFSEEPLPESEGLSMFDELLEGVDTKEPKNVEEEQIMGIEHEDNVPETSASQEFGKEIIDEIYNQLNDLSFANSLYGVSEESELGKAFTLQFGSIVFEESKPVSKLLKSTNQQPTPVTSDTKFKFTTNVPFVKDLATSYPSLTTGTHSYTNKFQIRLTPSIFQNMGTTNNNDASSVIDFAKFPPVEFQAELDGYGQIKLDTIELLTIEAMKNIAVPLFNMPHDIQVTKTRIGDLLKPQLKKTKKSKTFSQTNIDNQPEFAHFLQKSNLVFDGKSDVYVAPYVDLLVNNTKVRYDFAHLTVKTEMNFEFGERQLQLNINEGGQYGGRSFEVMMGEGDLSRDEFEEFLNDALQFINNIN
ncbi:Mitochondrial gene expression regulator [Lodderomyces elongisporus]|uniref:SLS domain-containing protein n=1 Tax=Lodderomyces elongisporus TaxID=36914 RepID=UPI00292176AD|nr:SLS domain-containing protein [Lodderomyces elongisporus]WLF81164.1 Mitochondrial gene expression regulator [Lodderomyces elongisporus]